MKKINQRVYYFADIFWETCFDSIEEEFEFVVGRPCRDKGIEFLKVTCTDLPPFGESYSILFFDWGGMSVGNDMLGSFCREITREAQDNPSKEYVMTSMYTKEAMEDALYLLSDDIKLPNIFLSVDDYIKYINN